MIDFEALIQVAIAGLLLGAGLPTLFAIGTRMLARKASNFDALTVPSNTTSDLSSLDNPSAPAGRDRTVGSGQTSLARKAVAYTCFGICVAAIVIGVIFLAAGGHS